MFDYIGSFYKFMGGHFRFWNTSINPNPIKGILPGTREVTMRTLRTPMPNKQHRSCRHRRGCYPDAENFPCNLNYTQSLVVVVVVYSSSSSSSSSRSS